MSKGSEAVIRWRQRAKHKLVAGFGGGCGICDYSRSMRALEFHHLDPTEKDFAFGTKGVPRSWSKMVAEALKCVMLCRNCHAEVHDGITSVPEGIRRFDSKSAGAALPLRRKPVRERGTNVKHTPRPSQEKVPDRPRGKSLRNLVCNTSRVAVAKRFGVSETAVRKWLVADTKAGLCNVSVSFNDRTAASKSADRGLIPRTGAK